MNGGLVRLREMLGQIPPSERIVAQYVLANPEAMIGMSVAELAKQSGGSQSAVIRLCKSMGFKGYQEFMLKVAGDLRQTHRPRGEFVEGYGFGYQELRPTDSLVAMLESVSNNNIQSIRDSLKVLDLVMVTKAVEAMNRADRIFFYGIGASNLIAQDFQHKFLRINKTCFAFLDSHLQLASAAGLKEGDAAVGISYSGETESVFQCVNSAKAGKAMTISITKYGSNRLSELADIPLYISSRENEIRSAATSSRITQLNLVDILFLGVASLRYESSVHYLNKSREAIKDFK